jgi:hypothetical protein
VTGGQRGPRSHAPILFAPELLEGESQAGAGGDKHFVRVTVAARVSCVPQWVVGLAWAEAKHLLFIGSPVT